MESKVDLPAPLAPTTRIRAPRLKSKDTFFNWGLPPAWLSETPLTLQTSYDIAVLHISPCIPIWILIPACSPWRLDLNTCLVCFCIYIYIYMYMTDSLRHEVSRHSDENLLLSRRGVSIRQLFGFKDRPVNFLDCWARHRSVLITGRCISTPCLHKFCMAVALQNPFFHQGVQWTTGVLGQLMVFMQVLGS